ncbi:MAG: hypothetical protein ABI559_04880 [Chloroflexota bacterium]
MRLAFVLLAFLLLAGACAQSETITSRDIIKAIPWNVPETTKMRVLDSQDKEVGTGTFKIEAADTGKIRLTQHFDFPDKGYVNDSQVVADATTLQPSTTNYDLTGPNGEITCAATYTTGKVAAHRVGQDGARDDTLDVPNIAYDSWADLFLWRTIDFGKSFETDYADILSCTLDKTQKQSVTLKVTDQESITVPAGTFDTWHLEIDSGGGTQDAWYATDALHTLIKYDNGDQTFELTQAGQLKP